MTIQTLSIAPSDATVAAFNAWGGAISAAIASAGLVKASDTGQINWGTNATTPPTLPGTLYEVWKGADSFQATAPMYIRLDYGQGNFSVGNPQIWVTFGTGTNGAGVISNVAVAQMPIFTNDTSRGPVWGTLSPQTLWVDSDGGSSLMIAGWFTNTAGSGGVMAVERTRNWDGTPNANGLMGVFGSSTSSTNGTAGGAWAYAAFATAYGGGSAAFVGCPGNNGGPSVSLSGPYSRFVGSTYYPGPLVGAYTPMLSAPFKHLIWIGLPDLTYGEQFTALMYGASHTYIVPTWPAAANVGAGGCNVLVPRIA
jgi:hypothetical protein